MNKAHRVVSSEAEELILVDENDAETGYLSKAASHDGGGRLHRAFSVFLFNDDGELLLQQRSAGKRLWPGYWSNTCCSHPRKGESMAVATGRRLQDELHIDTSLEFVYKFIYQASFGDAGSEHELCHVFLGRAGDGVQPNAHEISAVRYVSAPALGEELADRPEQFTPWLQLEWAALNRDHRDVLQKYCRP